MTSGETSRGGRTLISVVSPVYGCRDCLEALVDSLKQAFDGRGLDWELILVDDRDPDDPWPLIQRLVSADPRIRGLRLSRNHGQQLAIWAGLEAARGDWVAVIDCDLQDDPHLIPELHEKASAEELHAVVVKRGPWAESRHRRFLSRAFYRVLRMLAGFNLENVGNFGIYSRKAVDTLLRFREQEVFLPVMFNLTGLKTGFVEIERSGRYAGRSAYSFTRLVRLAMAVIIRFSDRPLKLSVIVGVLFSGVSAAVSICLFMLWLTGWVEVAGWTSTMLSVWFLSGVIIAVLGVHGMYLGRVFNEVKQRPRIIVESEAVNPGPCKSS